MTATVDAKDFANAVSWAMRAVPHKSVVPVLAAVPLTVHDGELTVSGFDFDTHARARVVADGDLDTTHVLGGMLAKIAPQLSGTVRLTADGTRLLITEGRDKYKLPIVPADDYPTAPSLPLAVGDSAGFIDAVARVAQSTAVADVRPVLQGVSLVAEDGTLTLRATDRHRMSRASIAWEGRDFATVAPVRVLTEFTKAIGVGRVTLHVSGDHFAITSGGFTASTLLIDDAYPLQTFEIIDNAREKALDDDGGVLIAPRSEFLGAVKRASIALGPNDPLRLYLSEEECLAVAVGINGEASSPISGTYIGPNFDVLISAAYLASIVDAVAAPYVVLGAHGDDGRQPIHIAGCPDDSGDPDEAAQHIILPRRKLVPA